MSGFFLDNYDMDQSENITFPFCPNYSLRHFQAASTSSSWLGRVVHEFLGVVGSIVVIGAVVFIAERALANLVQTYLTHPTRQLKANQVDDGSLIEEDESQDKHKKKSFLHLVGSLLNFRLGSGAQHSSIENLPDSKEVNASNSTQDSEISIKEAQRQATFEILSTDGFKRESLDQPFRLYDNLDLYKGEEQGTEDLRRKVALSTKSFPHAIGLSALKEQREINFEQYLIFKIKRFAHAHSLKGQVYLPSDKNMNLEGFCEAYTIPMIASSFDEYAKNFTTFSDDDRQWIMENFNLTTTSDSIESEDIERITLQIQDPNFIGPVSLGTGHHWHSTGTIFFGNFLLYCDRGSLSGIHVYYLPDRSMINEGVIWEMAKRQEIRGRETFDSKRIESQLNGQLVHHEMMDQQEAGNCTYTSMQAVLFAFLVMNGLKEIPQDVLDGQTWNEAFRSLENEYKNWCEFDKQMVFEDMIEEIQEWCDQDSDFSKKYNLEATYQFLLTHWFKKYHLSHPMEPLPSHIVKVCQILKVTENFPGMIFEKT